MVKKAKERLKFKLPTRVTVACAIAVFLVFWEAGYFIGFWNSVANFFSIAFELEKHAIFD